MANFPRNFDLTGTNVTANPLDPTFIFDEEKLYTVRESPGPSGIFQDFRVFEVYDDNKILLRATRKETPISMRIKVQDLRGSSPRTIFILRKKILSMRTLFRVEKPELVGKSSSMATSEATTYKKMMTMFEDNFRLYRRDVRIYTAKLDIRKAHIRFKDKQKAVVAEATRVRWLNDIDEYKVRIGKGVDALLILLGILSIDATLSIQEARQRRNQAFKRVTNPKLYFNS